MLRVGLVLGGGGVLGHAFHAGVLAALEEAGWDPRRADLMVGTSAGSYCAAFLRAGVAASDLAARTTGTPLSPEGSSLYARHGPEIEVPIPGLRHMALGRGSAHPGLLGYALRHPRSLRMGALVAAMLPAGTVSTSVISNSIRRFFHDPWAPAPTWIPAVRLDDGRLVAFGRGDAPEASLALAVAASCAIPAFFEPVRIGRHTYVDGGVHSPTNLDLVAHAKLDVVVVSSPMSAVRGSVALGPIAAVRAANRLRLAREAARVRSTGIDVVAFQPTVADQLLMGGNPMDPRRQREVATQARESARQRLRRSDITER